jgi:hypothetical protein
MDLANARDQKRAVTKAMADILVKRRELGKK